MKLSHTTTIQQSLSLAVTPKLIQSMRILQLSAADLARYVQEQSRENPFLEVAWNEHKARRRSKQSGTAGSGRAIDGLLELAANEPDTLETVLLGQLRLANLSDRSYRIAAFLAGNLNENGFLAITLKEAADCLQVREAEVAAGLEALQALEPAGVAARTLQECLQIQMRRDDKADCYAEQLVNGHLHELGSGKWKQLAQALHISLERVMQALAYIRTLNPRPGLAYAYHRQTELKPDALIQKAGSGYVIRLNQDGVPQVSLNKQAQQLSVESDCKTTSFYVKKHIQSAEWLIHSLKQRQQTLMRVIEAVAVEQLPFLDKGLAWLKPLNLKTIANRLQLHESTVSRTVRNKAVWTPQGTFELKFFFAAGLPTTDGESASTERIKCKIREFIGGENKSKPFSDQRLAERLVEEGIHISRRTVMKYREEMQLLSSRLRVSESGNAPASCPALREKL